MNQRNFVGIAAVELSMFLTVTLAYSQTKTPARNYQLPGFTVIQGPVPGRVVTAFHNGSFGSLTQRFSTECKDYIAKYCAGQSGDAAERCLTKNSGKVSGVCKSRLEELKDPDPVPRCARSVICGNRLSPGSGSDLIPRVEWDQTMGYTFTYPYKLPSRTGLGESSSGVGGGGVSAVALDSKGDLWVFERNDYGKPQLFKYGPDHKLLFAVPESVITHQYKAHGMKVDKDDNVWICDTDGSTVKELSPDGKLLRTIGVRGHRGDWDEAKGQRLLWQPVMIDFGPSGDIYIFEGHGEESPNDAGSDDPTNNIGAARVIHLDKNAKFINQWYGNFSGPGEFDQTHGSAVDPITGQVWIGDRMQYRIVVYTQDGRYLRTIQMKNTICALFFQPSGQLWVGTGQDGQYLKVDRNGKVLGAVGNGPGRGWGQFTDAAYFSVDSQGNIYAPDTSNARVTVMLAPKR